ncbi:hypothetical protein B0H13DRAFT_1853534 [Mycena leptocephala]|nr:hypothetical protein B0H13DRAFT_1853534 [Mycena leptocephala]
MNSGSDDFEGNKKSRKVTANQSLGKHTPGLPGNRPGISIVQFSAYTDPIPETSSTPQTEGQNLLEKFLLARCADGRAEKIQSLDSKPEESLRPPKQLKTEPPQPSSAPKIKNFSLKDVPHQCPDTYCQDLVPFPLPSHLLSLFERKYKLVQEAGPKALGCRQLTKEICSFINQELALSYMP